MQGDLLGGHLEAAQVWRQEHNPAAGVEHALDHVPVLDGGMARHAFRLAAPHESQLDDRLAGLGDGGAPIGAIAGLGQVGVETAAVGGGKQVDQPAQRGAEGVQHAQGEN